MNSKKLDFLIDSLEKQIESQEIENPNISKVNIGWHIDHSFKVVKQVVLTLQSSDPALYSNNFSFIGKLFFKLGFFPRGKAKAPKYVRPPEIILKKDLKNQLIQVREIIITIPNLDENAFFKHPMLGNINTKRVYRFLELHTDHHLKIIKEIRT